MKTCSSCREAKPLADFGRHMQKKDGLRSRCRSCERKPPRTGTCAACGEAFQYRQRGKELHICESCAPTHHWCHACKSAKPIGAFYRQSAAAKKISYRCKDCSLTYSRSNDGVRSRKAAAIRSRYGITLEEYEALLDAPEGTCPCCGRTNRRKMVMDHDHETGEIRGVICSGCNTGIGSLGDTIEGLQKAIDYLQRKKERDGHS